MGKGKKFLIGSIVALIGVGAAKVVTKYKTHKGVVTTGNVKDEANNIKHMCKLCGDKSEFCGYDDYCGYNEEEKKAFNLYDHDDYDN